MSVLKAKHKLIGTLRNCSIPIVDCIESSFFIWRLLCRACIFNLFAINNTGRAKLFIITPFIEVFGALRGGVAR
jgi:hypothetical protein